MGNELDRDKTDPYDGIYGQYSVQRQADKESELVRHVENLSNAALYRIIVENKFQPPANEKNIISYGVDH